MKNQPSTSDRSSTRRIIVAATIGNALEWYDFAIYGYFASILGAHFFPEENATASMLSIFGVFAAGFLMRPLGGLLYGPIGDRFGRSRALTLSVALMAIPTFLVGILPGTEQIGLAAPIALVLLRLLQGLSVGGEYTSSMILLVEQAPPGRRAFLGCWSVTGSVFGFVAGAGLSALATSLLSPEALGQWGWRIPFLLGAVVGLAGFYLRRRMAAKFGALRTETGGFALLAEVFREHWRTVARIAGLQAMAAVGFFMMFTYVTTSLSASVSFPEAEALQINIGTLVVLTFAIPLAAVLSDRIGRRPVLFTATIGTIVLAYPLFRIMHHDNAGLIIFGEMGFAILMALFYGAGAATMAEMVPRAVRCTVLALGYNAAYALLGGTTPMIATYLVERTGDDLSPAFFLIAAGVVSLGVVATLKESSRSPLP